jgi:hypothetical protein
MGSDAITPDPKCVRNLEKAGIPAGSDTDGDQVQDTYHWEHNAEQHCHTLGPPAEAKSGPDKHRP